MPGRRASKSRATLRGLLLCLGLSLWLAGCSRISDYVTIVGANHLHERGLYQDAAASYLSVRTGIFQPTVDYDLGNVYARLGEVAAAAELYARSRDHGDAALRADAYFNEGVALYEKGRYEEAWGSFRSSLTEALASGETGHQSLVADARRNLELAWKAWKKRSSAPPQAIAPNASSPGSQDDTELRLLRRLETGRWRPGAGAPPGGGRDDY
ncbi:MAG TPA: hypothetical protein VMC79_16485 [Rectinemataceae bacterium]|nr:hypothetical protein [Rectinemataceae bacterium]